MRTYTSIVGRRRIPCLLSAAIVGTVLLRIGTAYAVSSWSPTLLVNTEAIQIIDDVDSTANLALKFGSTINKSLTYDRTATVFRFDDDVWVNGTLSGSMLHARANLASSGTLVFEGAASGSSLFLGTSLKGAGLTDCDTEATSKVMWDATAGRFSCGTDQGGAGGGISYAAAEGMFVNQGGDTMTGALQVRVTSGTNNTLGVNVANTVSGAVVKAAKSLASSGSLSVETGQIGFNNVAYTWPTNGTNGSGLVLTLSGSTTNKLSWTPIIKRVNGSSGAAGSYITWQNLTANSANCTTTSLCSAAMTTTGVRPGTWKYRYTLIYQTAATTTGIGFAIDHTGTVGQIQHMWYHPTTGGAAATGIGDSDTATSAGQLIEGKGEGVDNTLIGSVTAGVDAANTDIMAILEGIIVVTATGDMQLKLQSEVASSAVRIMADSTLELMKIE